MNRSDKIVLPSGYEISLDSIPTVRDVIAINAQVGWIPATDDERALLEWAKSLMGRP